MTEVSMDIKANDRASSVLNHITKQLGLFNKQGLAMGIGFSLITKGIDVATQAIGQIIDYIQEGVRMNREFEMSMVRLGNSMREFDKTSLSSLKASLLNFSIVFAEDINILTSGMRDFIREGYNAAEALKMLYQSERLAIVAGDELATANQAVITSLEVFDLEVESVSYVAEQLNAIFSTTGLSLGELNNILGMNADKIHDVNINFSDLVNILIALDNEGFKSRKMISELNDILGDYQKTQEYIAKGKGFEKQADSIKSIEDKFKNLSSTTQFTAKQIEELNKAAQMRQTGGIDIGGMFDKRAMDEARRVKEIGITAAYGNDVWLHSIIKLATGMDTQMHKTMYLVSALEEYDKQQKEMKDAAVLGYFQRLAEDIDTASDGMAKAKASMGKLQEELSSLAKQKDVLTQTHNISTNLRYMELGLRDVSYASKIQDDAARNLVVSLNRQQKSIDELSDANQRLNLMMGKNSLEQMKIEYSASMHRGRMTREEKRKMKEIEQANMQLRISTTENELKMDEVKLDMTADQRRLDNIRLFYEEELYIIQDTYTQEMIAINNHMAGLATQYQTDTAIYKSELQKKYDATKTYYDELAKLRKTEGSTYAGNIFAQTGKNINLNVLFTKQPGDTPADTVRRIAQLLASGRLTGATSRFKVG